MQCADDECERKAVARSLCLMHYKRVRRQAGFRPTRPLGAGLMFLRELGESDECIEYPFGLFSTGYGHIKFEGRDRPAHVVSYMIHVGAVPEGLEVCHGRPGSQPCVSRACVNPRHLRVDTHAGNMADCLPHGTHTRGERNGRAQLTEVSAHLALSLVAGGVRQTEVARKLGVSVAAVNGLAAGRTWRHIARADIVRRVAD